MRDKQNQHNRNLSLVMLMALVPSASGAFYFGITSHEGVVAMLTAVVIVCVLHMLQQRLFQSDTNLKRRPVPIRIKSNNTVVKRYHND